MYLKDIIRGEQVCIYLKKHNAEYQRLQKKILEFTEKYPVIETFMETNQSWFYT